MNFDFNSHQYKYLIFLKCTKILLQGHAYSFSEKFFSFIIRICFLSIFFYKVKSATKSTDILNKRPFH